MRDIFGSSPTPSFTNTTPATSTVSQSSGTLTFGGQYWNGSTSLPDTWTIQDVIGNGTNGTSTLTFVHSGSPGIAQVSVPRLLINNGLSQPICFYMPSAINGVILQDFTSSGDMILFRTNAVYSVVMRSTLVLGWFSTTTLSGGGTNPDSGFSRLGAASVAVGNGTAGDFSGSLKLTTVQMGASAGAPTSAATAGTAGQIIYFGGNIYFCSVTGVAGSATWNKLNLTAV